MNPPRSALCPSEWLLVASLLLILGTLFVFSKIKAFRTKEGTICATIPVEVVVSGHVSKPGTYLVDPGTPVSEVIVKAKPKLFANLERFDSGARVPGACSYYIEPKLELTVRVGGACVEEELKVIPGTRICDLKKKITLQPGADLAFFKKKRRLADKETIKIPLKR